MIRLYNHTGLPDKPIRTILTFAQARIGVSGAIACKVTANKTVNGPYAGMAFQGFPYLAYLQDKPNKRWRGRMAKTPTGFMEIGLPWEAAARNQRELESAAAFVHTCLHEMSHILDFRKWIYDPEPRTPTGRRIAHDKRPCELRAENRVYDVMSVKRRRKRQTT